MNKHKRLLDAYRFEDFVPLSRIKGVFGDPLARIIPLQRRGKKRFAEGVEEVPGPSMTAKHGWCGTSLAGITGYTWKWRYGGFNARVAAR
jgi:hypothetical protein